jgi:N-acetyl-anhydromuramyl-L-alanine amidase AmpD
MNILQDNCIFDKYFKAIAENYKRESINEIIFHATAGFNTAQGLLNWMLAGQRASEYVKAIGLFHYLIDRNGDIYQIVPDEYWVYHSSSTTTAEIHDKITLGIEHINPSPQNADKLTDQQYNSSLALIKYLMTKYKIETIAGHTATALKYSGKSNPVPCPGNNFNWLLYENNLPLQKISEAIYKVT